MLKLPTRVAEAADQGNTAVVTAWLDDFPHINAMWDDAPIGGSTSMLMLASRNGHARLVDTLLERGASIDMQGSEGFTALMFAGANGHSAIVQRLMRAGAQLGLRNVYGSTALRLAEKYGCTECIQAIKEHLTAVATEGRAAGGVAPSAAGRSTEGGATDGAGATDELPYEIWSAAAEGHGTRCGTATFRRVVNREASRRRVCAAQATLRPWRHVAATRTTCSLQRCRCDL